MEALQKSTRELDFVINPNYKSEYSITYSYFLKNSHYYMEIKDMSENEILVKKTLNGDIQFAVYKMDNAKDFLKSLF